MPAQLSVKCCPPAPCFYQRPDLGIQWRLWGSSTCCSPDRPVGPEVPLTVTLMVASMPPQDWRPQPQVPPTEAEARVPEQRHPGLFRTAQLVLNSSTRLHFSVSVLSEVSYRSEGNHFRLCRPHGACCVCWAHQQGTKATRAGT